MMMPPKKLRFEQLHVLTYSVRWTLLVIPIAVAIGSVVALFLWLLHSAIELRFQYPWLLYLLPLAGVCIHFIYQSVGKSSEKGNNLVMEEIHQAGGGVPKQMAPIILITTIITHLFGGSAGREGTAVQIGGSIAAMFGKWFKLNSLDLRLVLTAGVAAGFGAVFGTPLTGAIFAMEVLTIGRIQYDALLPALIASVIGDFTVTAWGVHHTQYHIEVLPEVPYFLSEYLRIDLLLLVKVIVASAAFGLASTIFAGLVQEIKSVMLKLIKKKWLIPVAGGLTIIALTFAVGKPDYLSLGVDAEYPGAVTIPGAFAAVGADTWSWLWKTVFTAVTLATGFKGGEVTPLFYMGATLGNTLSGILDAPVSLFAALGFIAVFAGATNTPLACTIMGVELFGGEHILLFAVACFTAYLFSGHSGIYSSQKIAVPKITDPAFADDASLAEAYKRKGYLHQKLGRYSTRFRRKDLK
ncbi:voltage-gated chloride channel family protein [Pontibacter sp. SGAir0037]|uniref:voltage-gated chloride channel family protein n=1 Tax=Pontibacter sp. SGAir0037 TaxID=2571030 RepID=UPI0010CD3119|nr:voltage-gated chloride channel family protein [Pontibacter sp. SGAir0037]QCR24941.1 voltage-gated chloride channel protein [Pontibacter sp. SGAir0037]